MEGKPPSPKGKGPEGPVFLTRVQRRSSNSEQFCCVNPACRPKGIIFEGHTAIKDHATDKHPDLRRKAHLEDYINSCRLQYVDPALQTRQVAVPPPAPPLRSTLHNNLSLILKALSHCLLASLDVVLFRTCRSCLVSLGDVLFLWSCSPSLLKARKLFERPSAKMAVAERANGSPVNLAKQSQGLGPISLLQVPRPTLTVSCPTLVMYHSRGAGCSRRLV
jgi:hypothetical protein